MPTACVLRFSRGACISWFITLDFRLNCTPMLEPLTNPQIRKFKAAAQLLEPMLKVGKAGLSEGFVKTVSDTLAQHELVKIKFADFKEQKKELAPLLAEKTGSHLIMRVGNVMVLHRPRVAATSASQKSAGDASVAD